MTSLYLCPIVWSCDCGCVTPLPPITDCMRAWENAPVMLWLAPDIPSPTPHLRGEQQCHEWMTYPHKILSKNTHIYCTRKDALNQNTILSYWCAFQWKISFHFPHSTQLSQFGSFHRQSIFHILFTHKLCTLSIYLECYIYALIYISHIFDNLYHISIYSYILSNSSGSLSSSF